MRSCANRATSPLQPTSATSSSYGNSNVNFEVKDGKVVVDVDDAGTDAASEVFTDLLARH